MQSHQQGRSGPANTTTSSSGVSVTGLAELLQRLVKEVCGREMDQKALALAFQKSQVQLEKAGRAMDAEPEDTLVMRIKDSRDSVKVHKLDRALIRLRQPRRTPLQHRRRLLKLLLLLHNQNPAHQPHPSPSSGAATLNGHSGTVPPSYNGLPERVAAPPSDGGSSLALTKARQQEGAGGGAATGAFAFKGGGGGGLEVALTEREAPGEGTAASRGFQVILQKTNERYLAPGVSERLLLRDLLFVLQGCEGQYVKKDPNTGLFFLDPRVSAAAPVRDCIAPLSELGYLYTMICAGMNKSSGYGAYEGLVFQAFNQWLKDQLTEYYKLVALLESSLTPQLCSGERWMGMEVPPEGGLTLRRLAVWVQEPLERMRLLACLVDAAMCHKGGSLASALYAHSRRGDPVLRGLMADLVERVTLPLLEMIRLWMEEGQLRDPHGELFVASWPHVPNGQLWRHKYYLNVPQVPVYLPLETSRKVLLTGKSVSFVRNCCQDGDWLEFQHLSNAAADSSKPHTRPARTSASGKPSASGESGAESGGVVPPLPPIVQQLQLFVDQAAEKQNRRLVELLRQKYKLFEHFKALRAFLLLGQGDFIEWLIELAKEELNRGAREVYRHTLIGILDAALRNSNAQFHPADTLDRLTVKLHTPSIGDLGWDVFSLDYAVSTPLNVIFTPDAMQQYLRIFQLLWKTKRASHELSRIWSAHMATSHRAEIALARGHMATEPINDAIKMCHGFRAELYHWSQNLQAYFMHEVLDTAWQEFENNLNSCTDLDRVIAQHDSYLNAIQDGLFLRDVSASSRRAPSPPRARDSSSDPGDVSGGEVQSPLPSLQAILDLIIRFTLAQKGIFNEALAKSYGKRRGASPPRDGAAGGGGGECDDLDEDDGGDGDDGDGEVYFGLGDDGQWEASLQEILIIRQDYRNHLQHFITAIQALSRDTKNDSLSYLASRLDFNEFYTKPAPGSPAYASLVPLPTDLLAGSSGIASPAPSDLMTVPSGSPSPPLPSRAFIPPHPHQPQHAFLSSAAAACSSGVNGVFPSILSGGVRALSADHSVRAEGEEDDG
ncbi:unnamed protein product [Vitrella brassicaformis CCMP3155]|uniref:Uncharacterized protein n=2 Tax=Vitrella brassicaformis TaxID=1169539 RepID=A0A0G4EX60_VITBC|nr:unnamed protein product [Vitrella brassicaformis CCMP3155]|eukprot:CEM02679.1 unnamed protein product [Vitrella brassicaformis CCMP3155]